MGAFRNGDDPTEAMALLNRALALPLPPEEEAKARFYIGICYRSMDDEERAMAYINKALELDPTYAPARMATMGDEIRVPERVSAGALRPF